MAIPIHESLCSDQLTQTQMIDVGREAVELAGTSKTGPEDLASHISDSDPRYSFFRYRHEHEGHEQSPIVFIYTCPSGSKIKERMIYASSRAGVIAAAGKEAGVEVAKKVRSNWCYPRVRLTVSFLLA